MTWCDICWCDIFDDEDMFVDQIINKDGNLILVFMCSDCYRLY